MRYQKFFSALLASTVVTTGASLMATPVVAQAPDSTRIAGIVAIVGDSVITSAFLLDASGRRMQELKQAGRPMPTTAEAVKSMQEELINERIEELVILQTIARDTTYKVNEDNVTTVVEERYKQMETEQGGPIVFAQRLRASGMGTPEYKALLANQVRTEELFKQFRSRMNDKRQAPKASEKDIEELFPLWQQSRGPRPGAAR